MCGLKGYDGFSAVLVFNRVSILAGFGHFGNNIGYGFCTLALMWARVFFHHYQKENQKPFTNYVYSNLTISLNKETY